MDFKSEEEGTSTYAFGNRIYPADADGRIIRLSRELLDLT